MYMLQATPYKPVNKAMTSEATLLHPSPAPPARASSVRLSLTTRISFSGIYKVSTRASAKDIHTGCMQVTTGLSQYSVSVTQWPETTFRENRADEETPQVFELDEIRQRIEVIKSILQSIDDGELSISAYDTAWVALVKDIHGSDAPQFPASLEWIINNQHPDGSWGDRYFFSAYDRLSCTLACVIALTTWGVHPEKSKKGISFVRKNLYKLKDEDAEHMPSGFEVRFPYLIEMAQNLGLEIPQDSNVLQELYATRDLKLKRIPKEILHNVPTTLLYSLEGMPDLDWEKLLKLQHPNGSFLCSTSSTAYALMQTKDEKCLNYLNKIVERFNGGAPHCYPIDVFERLWVVDRLERLGISRYLKSEIKECLDYVSRYWTSNGISWSRDTIELDIDDTSMGFRILRSHGYEVNANAFQHFEKEGQFFCFVGQTSQGVTEMLSLYRASQVLFPTEEILEEAKKFASEFLREKQDLGQVADRWIISKDLAGEVQYALGVPWYASLPRLETRYYIDQYGGDDDVWIGKVLYRMYNVSNNLYLELAKLDYNHSQKLHQLEWIDIQKWYNKYGLRDFGVTKDGVLKAYFLAMSHIFEPDKAIERVAWAQTATLMQATSYYFKSLSLEQKKAFIQSFTNRVNQSNYREASSKVTGSKLHESIFKTLSDISLKVRMEHRKEVQKNLKHSWNEWLLKSQSRQDKRIFLNDEAELLVCTINLCSGHSLSVDFRSKPKFVHLTNLVNEICNRLHQTQNHKVGEKKDCIEEANKLPTDSVERKMQELVQHVFESNNGIKQEIKTTFLMVAKSYYYSAYTEPAAIDLNIAKVLFERVL